MRLERAQDEVLVPELTRIVGGGHPRYLLRAGHAKFEAVSLDRLEMRTTCNDTNLVAGGCQANRQIAADGAGTIDTEFHGHTRDR
jgi:hypothetical protein